MEISDRYKDNANGVISDSVIKIGWLPKDSWIDLGKWVNWEGAQSYARLMNQVYAGGFSDWRLPTKEEALSLYDVGLNQKDWADEMVHIHPLFVGKCSHKIWTSDIDANGMALCLNLRDGSEEYIDKNNKENYGARLTRSMK